jgi:type I restriction enzyme S subunit
VSFDELKLSEADIEIIDGDRGVNYPKQNEFYDIGYCLFLNAKNVTKDGFDFNEKSFISREKDNLLRKGKLVRNDIVLTTRGTVGNVAFYNNRVPFNNIRINSGMVILRAKQSEYLPEFVYWMFRSNYIQDQINALKTGSAQPQLPITIMRTIKVLKPKLCEQKVIAATLSALDDMIELNNQINKTLEEMAQARQRLLQTANPGARRGAERRLGLTRL